MSLRKPKNLTRRPKPKHKVIYKRKPKAQKHNLFSKRKSKVKKYKLIS